MSDDVLFLLWSNKHQMWWRALGRGYTHDINEAGRYDQATAVDRVVQSAYNGTIEMVTCMVVAPPTEAAS